ncbi:hypothetical protein MNBD_ALPHA01-2091 [hydrothermal vent metagenome]|uniref:Uncharacterized protein n=1 Tax=hydrothermal vent metagenome TaxID=652676 RepID=A0A3B0SEF9_9ZZZZ
MSQPSIQTNPSVEKYLRYGKGQSYIVINNHPEQKGTAEQLSMECSKVWVEFNNVKLTHDEVREEVLKLQNVLNQINITIENMLRRIKDPRTGKLLHMAAVLIPLLRAARHARSTRKVIAVVGDLLGDLLDISDLYPPIRRARDLFVNTHNEFIILNKERDKLKRQEERLFRRYNNMNCPTE